MNGVRSLGAEVWHRWSRKAFWTVPFPLGWADELTQPCTFLVLCDMGPPTVHMLHKVLQRSPSSWIHNSFISESSLTYSRKLHIALVLWSKLTDRGWGLTPQIDHVFRKALMKTCSFNCILASILTSTYMDINWAFFTAHNVKRMFKHFKIWCWKYFKR